MSKILKSTRQRKAISNILNTETQPLSASEIYDRLCETGESMALSTVYRTLSTMENAGVLEKTTLPTPTLTSVYLLRTPEHIHYAICLRCKKQFPIPGCPIEAMEDEVEKDLGFTITSHQITLYGYCHDCQES